MPERVMNCSVRAQFTQSGRLWMVTVRFMSAPLVPFTASRISGCGGALSRPKNEKSSINRPVRLHSFCGEFSCALTRCARTLTLPRSSGGLAPPIRDAAAKRPPLSRLRSPRAAPRAPDSWQAGVRFWTPTHRFDSYSSSTRSEVPRGFRTVGPLTMRVLLEERAVCPYRGEGSRRSSRMSCVGR